MVSVTDVLIVLSPVLITFGILANAERIVSWWDNKHPTAIQKRS